MTGGGYAAGRERGETASMDQKEAGEALRRIDDTLSEIERTLDQMLALAELSASDLNVDRDTLQKTLERLGRKIDRLADALPPR